MSKEMTPKGALDELCDLATPNGDCLNYVIGLSGIILKALERLEQLEKENQWLKELIKEYKRLKELANQVIEKFQIGKKNLTEENEKYKKVITWLKNTFEIALDSKVRISDGTDCIQAFPIDLKTNEVIYDLLKEVLG